MAASIAGVIALAGDLINPQIRTNHDSQTMVMHNGRRG